MERKTSQDSQREKRSTRSWATRLIDHVPPAVARTAGTNPRLRRLLVPLIKRLAPRGPQEVSVRSGPAQGLKLLILPRVERFYWAGTHEPAVQTVLTSILGPGAVFWDVGAHCGFFSLLASRLVGPRGRVVSFEPSSANRDRLNWAIEANRSPNIEVLPNAVSAETGTAVIYSHEQSNAWSLLPGETTKAAGNVPCTTLDDISADLPHPTLIKLDVEGAEVDAVRGARRLLAAQGPSLIVEFHQPQKLSEARALLPGYEFRQLESIQEPVNRQWLLTPTDART